MKKLFLFLLIAVSTSPVSFCQTTMAKKSTAEARVIAIEKAGWQAWKNKDVAWYKANVAADFLMVNGEGITNKADIIKSIPAGCEVKSFSLDDFKFVMLNESAVMLTYTAMQDAVCNGKTLPAKVRSTVNYIKRGGKWLEVMYMETPVTQ